MREKSKIDKIDYFSDGELYTVWKYLNRDEPIEAKAFRFWNITPAGGNIDNAVRELIRILEFTREELSGIRFDKNSYAKRCPEEYNGVLEFIKIKNNPKMIKAIKGVFDNKFDTEDVKTVCGFRRPLMLGFFEFDKKITAKTREKLDQYIELYIKDFIKDQLYTSGKNYYKFEKQKDITILGLREGVKKYGDSFTIEYGKNAVEFASWDEKYLFIHSLLAMEHQKCLAIDKMWVYDCDDPIGKKESYKAEIMVEEKCFSGSGSRDKTIRGKENLKPPVFDEKQSKIKYGLKELKIPYGTIEYCLCKTLFKEPVGKPVSWDEVAEECDGSKYNQDKETKFRTVYDAHLRLNEKARQGLGIKKLCEWKKMTIFRAI